MLIRISVLVIFYLITTMESCYGQSINNLVQLFDPSAGANSAQFDDAVISFINESGGTPIIENNTVTFLARSNGEIAPQLVADFNGFLNKRYVEDQSLGRMKRLHDSDWYYFQVDLVRDAVVNYRLRFDGKDTIDVLNPNVRQAFGSDISYVAMPEYVVMDLGYLNKGFPKDRLVNHGFESEIMGHTRNVNIYLPPEYDRNKQYPTAYFHDGTPYIDWAKIPQMLDRLIDDRMIEPVIAVFDDPVVRGKEYRNDSSFRKFVAFELIAFVDSAYSTIKDSSKRAVIGGSRGGQSALYLSHSLNAFQNCGAFSPAIHPKSIEEFTSDLKSFKYQPNSLFISGSVYDHIWYKDAVKLNDYFGSKVMSLKYQEQSEGHNIAAWRKLLGNMLQFFFPYKS